MTKFNKLNNNHILEDLKKLIYDCTLPILQKKLTHHAVCIEASSWVGQPISSPLA